MKLPNLVCLIFRKVIDIKTGIVNKISIITYLQKQFFLNMNHC